MKTPRPPTLSEDPIKRAKHKTYKEVMKFARGGMAERFRAHSTPKVTDGREGDDEASAEQADKTQDSLDQLQKGTHGKPQLDDETAEHTGLGEKEDPLGMRELHEKLKGKKDGEADGLSGLLKDLQDHEVEQLLKRGKK